MTRLITLMSNVSKMFNPTRMSTNLTVIDSRFKSTLTNNPNLLVIDKNISLRSEASIDDRTKAAPESRPLVILLGWLTANERTLRKYRDIYFKYGFDVLTVKTRPMDVIFPATGANKIAAKLLDFLKMEVATYPNVVIHGFSIGGYQFGELSRQLQEGLSKPHIDGTCKTVRDLIKGVIHDSPIDVGGAAYGLSRSITKDEKRAQIIEKMINFYMKVFYNIMTKHMKNVSVAFHNTPVRCPALMLYSKKDVLADPNTIEKCADGWRKQGIEVSMKRFDDSTHVAHYRKYPTEYVNEIETFLKNINLAK